MGQQHTRRKRRPRLQKPDTVNIILGSLTIILLFVWGGLYWKESSQQALIVNANGAAQSEQALQEEVGLPAAEPGSASPAVDAPPAATDETVKPAEQAADKPGVSGEGTQQIPEETAKPAVREKAPLPAKTSKPASTAKPNKQTVTKQDAGVKAKPETPIATETEPPISLSEKYERQIVQVQAKCTQDMNEVLAGAESSIEQMDKSDPYAFQQLNQKWVDELANVESACTSSFQEIIQKAENDAVEPEITEEWEQTFSALMLKLQSEFEAKLLQLMEG